jgi:hypothetical protein
MDSATQQNAALVEQAAASAQALREQTVALNQVVSVFRLDGDTDAVRAVNDEPSARKGAALQALPA